MNNRILVLALCILSAAGGYEVKSWLTPSTVKAQGPVAVEQANRFQLISTKSTQHGDLLVDTLKGRVFEIYMNGPSGTDELRQFPIKACVDADCKTWKGEQDGETY